MLNKKEKLIRDMLKDSKLEQDVINDIMHIVKKMNAASKEDLFIALGSSYLLGPKYIIDMLKEIDLLPKNYKYKKY